jgi:dethiobiotin synthetase
VIVAVSGTGTGVGKTHVACALLRALRERGGRAVGWKPVESGVTRDRGDDEDALRDASGGEVAGPTLRLRAPLSPHLAARREGISIDAAALRTTLDELAARWPLVVLELAGGLFSPFDDLLANADWLAPIRPALVVVAPDRLGVLHDVGATVRAATAVGLALRAVVLSAPEQPDASTGTNAGELRARHASIAVASVPRAPIAALARDPAILALAGELGPG